MIENRDAVSGEGVEGGANPALGEEVPVEELLPPPAQDASVDGTGPGEPPLAEQVVDYKDRWLRTEADLQNFRRRAARDRDDSVTRAQDSVLLEAIGVLDDLERALAALASDQAAQTWAQGVVLTAQRLRDLLGRWDVREIEAVGRPFDPSVHEALLEVDAPEGIAAGAVAQVVQKGYRRGERALRAARVVVAKSAEQG